MNRPTPMLRLTPEAAGALQRQCTKATTELQELTRFRKEFDRQLAALIGNDAERKLFKDKKRSATCGPGQGGFMSQDSRHHRNPAHASPVPGGPTRYRTPEESGMTMELHTTQTSTALLCSVMRVDAPETNSLCCAAAGITAPLSAAAEALIPHEKLREAATPDATLIAQDRPPAQPVVGYTQAQAVTIAQEAA